MLEDFITSYHHAEIIGDHKKMKEILNSLYRIGMDTSTFRAIYATWKHRKKEVPYA